MRSSDQGFKSRHQSCTNTQILDLATLPTSKPTSPPSHHRHINLSSSPSAIMVSMASTLPAQVVDLPSQHESRLTRLPDELLLLVLDGLALHDRFFLSYTCRIMRRVCIAIGCSRGPIIPSLGYSSSTSDLPPSCRIATFVATAQDCTRSIRGMCPRDQRHAISPDATSNRTTTWSIITCSLL